MLWDWTKQKFSEWVAGWQDSLNQMWQNGQYDVSNNGEFLLMDILCIAAIIGVLLHIAGIKQLGNKLLLGSIMIGLIWMVIFGG
jgi:hypothetical protein